MRRGVKVVGGVWVCRGSCLRRNDERGRKNDGYRWVSGMGGGWGEGRCRFTPRRIFDLAGHGNNRG